jgi:hypothetical protein
MTDTVRMLCERMREEQDFTALPILADAVEESGDAELAGALRQEYDWVGATRIVAKAMGGEFWEAVLWIDVFAEAVSREGDEYSSPTEVTYVNLMTTLKNSYEGGRDMIRYYGINTPDECYENSDEMWRAFLLITGLPKTARAAWSVFTCSC